MHASALVAPSTFVGMNRPWPQGTHVDSSIAPLAFEYFPETQGLHKLANPFPVVVLYVPCAHGTQASIVVAPREVLNDPAGQGTQSAREEPPSIELYVPATQLKHTDGADAPIAREYFPELHRAQSSTDCAPGIFDHVSAGQLSQVDPLPDASVYSPSAQASHCKGDVDAIACVVLPGGHCLQIEAPGWSL